MAEWTQERLEEARQIAYRKCRSSELNDVVAIFDLAARGLAATEDAAKARALRDAAYAVIECVADDGTLNDARDAVFNMVPAYNAVDEWLRLCPEPTKTGESDG